MLDLAAHHDLRDAFLLADVDELAEGAEGDPVVGGGEGFDFGGGFLFDADLANLWVGLMIFGCLLPVPLIRRVKFPESA